MENWKEIEGYEGLYEVSNHGRVKALCREVTNKNGHIQRYPERILKADTHNSNTTTYKRVTLSKQHTTKRYCVHRLVATAFIPNPEDKPCVNHLDNNGQNNWDTNLEWCTHSENMIHAQVQGRLFESQSKGGREGSKVHIQKAVSNCTSMVGITYGNWKVIEYIGREGKGEGKHYVMCKCLSCDKTIQRVQATRLTRGETTNCRSCGQLKKKI